MRTTTRPRRAPSTRHHAPTRHGHRGTPAATHRRATLERLLAHRDRLADRLHEAEAHDHPDALDLAQLLGATENAIGNLDRSTLRAHVARWAERDAQRAHRPDDPRPGTCPTCDQARSDQARSETPNTTAPPPPATAGN